MTQQRIAQLLQLAAQAKLNAVAIMPGPNMPYFTGLHFHRSERPTLAICEDEEDQAGFVIRQILGHREEGIPLRRQAVLFRAGHHSDQLEIGLARRNIPFHKYGGLKFLEAAHVKDLLAFLIDGEYRLPDNVVANEFLNLRL